MQRSLDPRKTLGPGMHIPLPGQRGESGLKGVKEREKIAEYFLLPGVGGGGEFALQPLLKVFVVRPGSLPSVQILAGFRLYSEEVMVL